MLRGLPGAEPPEAAYNPARRPSQTRQLDLKGVPAAFRAAVGRAGRNPFSAVDVCPVVVTSVVLQLLRLAFLPIDAVGTTRSRLAIRRLTFRLRSRVHIHGNN